MNLFRRLTDATPLRAESATEDYRLAWEDYFSTNHDPAGLKCERNLFRYRPCRGVIIRLLREDSASEAAAQSAAQISGAALVVSRAWEESAEARAERIPQLASHGEFLRMVHGSEESVLRAAAAVGINWIDAPVSASGRLELTRWLREQSVSETRHRYGNQVPD